MYINFVCHVQMSKYMNKNQDIHLFKSYISVSFKPLKMLCVIFSAVSVSPIYPFLGQQPMMDEIFPTFLLFLFNFNVVLCLSVI